MICEQCGCQFEAAESIGSDFGLCQDDWEAYCAQQWWAMEFGGVE